MMRIGLIVAAASLAMAAWADAPLFDFGEGERSLWLTDAATGEKVFRFGNLSFSGRLKMQRQDGLLPWTGMVIGWNWNFRMT